MTRFYGHFAAGLLNPQQATPEGLMAHHGQAAHKRYNVYRNNVTSSLVEALGKIFPATERLVGQEFFKEMARQFIRKAPPQSPLIAVYGAAFPAFIQAYEPAKTVPYLADIATLERAWLDAYHAADVPLLTADALAQIPPEQLGDLVFYRHPAAHLVASRYPVISIFAANKSGHDMSHIKPSQAEAGLITRPALEVYVLALPLGHYGFFASLFEGLTLGEAAAQAMENTEGFDITTAITGTIQSGAFSHISIHP